MLGQVQKLWRHSYVAEHYIVNLPAVEGSVQATPVSKDLSPQRSAQWCGGDGVSLLFHLPIIQATDSTVAFVFASNVYLLDAASNTHTGSISFFHSPMKSNHMYVSFATAVTTDGVAGKSLGGVDSEFSYGLFNPILFPSRFRTV